MHEEMQIQNPHFPNDTQPPRRLFDLCRSNTWSPPGVPETKHDSSKSGYPDRKGTAAFAR